MTESAAEHPLPPSVARVLSTFRALGREEKMQALLHYAKKLEPVPERFLALDPAAFNVPECQTRVDLFPELRDGKLYFYTELDPRQSPTIAAFLAIPFLNLLTPLFAAGMMVHLYKLISQRDLGFTGRSV